MMPIWLSVLLVLLALAVGAAGGLLLAFVAAMRVCLDREPEPDPEPDPVPTSRPSYDERYWAETTRRIEPDHGYRGYA